MKKKYVALKKTNFNIVVIYLQESDFKEDYFEIYKTASLLKITKKLIGNEEFEKAEELLVSLLPSKNSKGLAFYEGMETLLYSKFYAQDQKYESNTQINLDVFQIYAFLLVEVKNYDIAKNIMNEGLKFNSVDSNLLHEKGEIYKQKKDWKSFKEITDFSIKYSFRAEDVARGFRSLGYYFVEVEDFDTAICCYIRSIVYYDTPMAHDELKFIEEKMGKDIELGYYCKNSETILKKKDIEEVPCVYALNIAYGISEEFEKELDSPERNEMIRELFYFYDIIYDLTADEEIIEKIERLKSVNN